VLTTRATPTDSHASTDTRTSTGTAAGTDAGAGAATLVVRARRAFVEGALRPAQVHVRDGLIVAVEPYDAPLDARLDPLTGPASVRVDETHVLLPGLVDSHVHVNEPGRTHWEGFATATRAAAAGGVTTFVDMPLNSIPPTTTPDALRAKVDATRGKLAVDVAFWGGAVPENLGSLGALHDAGVLGFKAFLAPSGVDEFGHLDGAQLLRALAEVAELGTVLVVHAEDPAALRPGAAGGSLGPRYADFVASRPPASEETAIARLVDGVRRTGARAHVLHLSDAGALGLVRAARAEGLPITAETCPHYLTLDAESVPDAATQFKCCPPIRSRANQELLWEAVLDGTISAIVSDHSPATPELKHVDGDFGRSWGGIAGLQLGFAAVWTQARRRGIALTELLPAFTTGPAHVAGLDRLDVAGPGADAGAIGTIAVGAPADLVVLAPDDSRRIDARRLEHRNPDSPYDGATLTGIVEDAWVRGHQVVTGRAVTPGATPPGMPLLRG
jgi:allantoinase